MTIPSIRTLRRSCLALSAIVLFTLPARAGLSEAEVAPLGQDLTPSGAEFSTDALRRAGQ